MFYCKAFWVIMPSCVKITSANVTCNYEEIQEMATMGSAHKCSGSSES